jgi:O-acetyl-ADP-ribose deacetylase (regulator of RNase III)
MSSSSRLLRSQVIPQLLHQFTTTTISNSSAVVVVTPPQQQHQIRRTVELWTTSCIVTNFGRRLWNVPSDPPTTAVVSNNSSNSSPMLTSRGVQNMDAKSSKWVLINPSNTGLTGCRQFPYFPRGGPVPSERVTSAVHRDWQPLGYVTQWGGMEVGTGMLYPTSVVDGLVHLYGGTYLQTELYWIRQQQKYKWRNHWLLQQLAPPWKYKKSHDDNDYPEHTANNEACPVGAAIRTSAGNGALSEQYHQIVHTTPPFYKYNDHHPTDSVQQLLSSCYQNSFQLAFSPPWSSRQFVWQFVATPPPPPVDTIVAVPLLGAGARGFPVDIAGQIAAESIVSWLLSHPTSSSASDGITSDNNRNDNSNYCTTRRIRRCQYRPNDDDHSNMNSSSISSITSRTGDTNCPHPPTQHQIVVVGLLETNVVEQLAQQILQRI